MKGQEAIFFRCFDTFGELIGGACSPRVSDGSQDAGSPGRGLLY